MLLQYISKKTYIYITLFLLFLTLISAIFAPERSVYDILQTQSRKSTEGFVPAINQVYRPFMRDMRSVTEPFFSEKQNNINRLLRQFGIY